jgi:hypothetical protein
MLVVYVDVGNVFKIGFNFSVNKSILQSDVFSLWLLNATETILSLTCCNKENASGFFYLCLHRLSTCYKVPFLIL